MGDLGSVPGLGRSPGEEHGNPLQYSCLENPHGQRSLAGYSPWGHKESVTTECLRQAHVNILVQVRTEMEDVGRQGKGAKEAAFFKMLLR